MANPKFNPNRPKALVRGDKRIRFIQDGNCFDVHGDFVEKADKSWQPRLAKAARVEPDADDVRERAEALLKDTPDVPSTVVDASKENLQALAAEDAAD